METGPASAGAAMASSTARRRTVWLSSSVLVAVGVMAASALIGDARPTQVLADRAQAAPVPTAVPPSCDFDGVTSNYGTTYNRAAKRYDVTTVTVSNIASSCAGAKLTVALYATPPPFTASALVSQFVSPLPNNPGTVTVTLPAGTSASLVYGVHVELAGGSVQIPAACQSMSFNNIVVGTPSSDVLTGTNKNDYMVGLAGNDSYSSQNADDCVWAFDGSNTITTGNGTSVVIAGNGANAVTMGNNPTPAKPGRVNLGGGSNTVDVGNGPYAIQILGSKDSTNTVSTGTGNSTITVTNGTANLTVGSGDNTITTGPGDDVIRVGTGRNRIQAGAGNNVCYVPASGKTTILNYDGAPSCRVVRT